MDTWPTLLKQMAGAYTAKLKRAYTVAKPTHQRPRHRSIGDANAVVGAAGLSLRQQARHADENFDLAHGVLDTLTARVVGRGLVVEPQVLTPSGDLNDRVNDQIADLVQEHAADPDVSGMYTMAKAERAMCRTWLRDGEALTAHVSGAVADLPGSDAIPYRFQILEPDYLPIGYPDSTSPLIIQAPVDGW